MKNLQQDLEPVSTQEELLVRKIAQEYWRLGAAARHEAEEFTRERLFSRTPIDRILRYQSTINRQLFQAINELERLQRLREGDNVPAPVAVQVSHDRSIVSHEVNPEL